MLAIDFKAPVEVTITFDDSDDEENTNIKKEIFAEDIPKTSKNVEKTNRNITQLDNQKEKENSQNSDKSQHSCKNDNAISCKCTVETKKSKLEIPPPIDAAVDNSEKNTVITHTQGQTHIIVAPSNINPLVDETKKINKCLDNSLKTISEHLIFIIEAYQQFSSNAKNTAAIRNEYYYQFLAVKNHFFSLSYSAVVSIMVPQESDMLFVTRFLKDTLKLCKEKNTVKITNEQQIFPFYCEMLDWAKKYQKHIPEIKYVNHKNQNQISVSEKSAQNKNNFNKNISDDRNARLKCLLNSERTRSSTNLPIFSKNKTMPYCNTNFPHEQGNASDQTNLSLSVSTNNLSHSVVSGISNTVTNTFPSNLNVTYGLANYINSNVKTTSKIDNQYQQVHHGLSQMSPSGQNLVQQSLGPTRTQYSASQMRHINQSPYLQHIQWGLAQTVPKGNTTNRIANLQNVSQNAVHTYFNPRNINTNSASQSYLRDDRNVLNQTRTELRSGNVETNIPAPKVTHQNNIYNQSRNDQQVQWTPNKQAPQYDVAFDWKNVYPQNAISTEQQLAQAAPTQRSTPVAQWQQQAEPQPLEVTRSISTDSGIVSPLPQLNTIGATNMYNIEEEQPTPFITHVTSLNPKVSYINEGNCSVCCKTTKLKCLCLEKYYCSYECQESDWNNHSVKCSTQKATNRQGH